MNEEWTYVLIIGHLSDENLCGSPRGLRTIALQNTLPENCDHSAEPEKHNSDNAMSTWLNMLSLSHSLSPTNTQIYVNKELAILSNSNFNGKGIKN